MEEVCRPKARVVVRASGNAGRRVTFIVGQVEYISFKADVTCGDILITREQLLRDIGWFTICKGGKCNSNHNALPTRGTLT